MKTKKKAVIRAVLYSLLVLMSVMTFSTREAMAMTVAWPAEIGTVGEYKGELRIIEKPIPRVELIPSEPESEPEPEPEPEPVVPEPEPEPKPEPEEYYEEPAYDYSSDDRYILAHVICGEAQGCSWELQVAVGSVVLNRVNSSEWPGTIAGVVFQSGQYACVWDGNYYREPTETNWAVADYLLANGSQLPSWVVYQSNWSIGTYYTTIENVVFSG